MRFLGKARFFALLSLVLAVVFVVAGNTEAASRKIAKALNEAGIQEYGYYDGPAYLIVSLTPMFDKPFIDNFNQIKNDPETLGSPIWLIRNGIIQSSEFVETVTFIGDDPVVAVGDLADAIMDGNQATFIGGWREVPSEMPHIATPTGDPFNPIPPDIQEAFVNASRMFDDALMAGADGTLGVRDGALTTPTTTVALATFIKLYGGPGGSESPVDVNDIMNFLLVGDMTMSCNSPCVAEGDLFGHDPSVPPIFFYTGRLDKAQGGGTTVELFVGRQVEVRLKNKISGAVINLGASGAEPFAIYSEVIQTSDGPVVVFDPSKQIDRSTIQAAAFDKDGFPIAALSYDADRTNAVDLNDDGVDDLRVFFLTEDLANTVEVEQDVRFNVIARTAPEGMPVKGSVVAHVVPK